MALSRHAEGFHTHLCRISRRQLPDQVSLSPAWVLVLQGQSGAEKGPEWLGYCLGCQIPQVAFCLSPLLCMRLTLVLHENELNLRLGQKLQHFRQVVHVLVPSNGYMAIILLQCNVHNNIFVTECLDDHNLPVLEHITAQPAPFTASHPLRAPEPCPPCAGRSRPARCRPGGAAPAAAPAP